MKNIHHSIIPSIPPRWISIDLLPKRGYEARDSDSTYTRDAMLKRQMKEKTA